MKNDSILRGYTTQATAYEVKDYPYGFRLRTSIFYWIETKKGLGDRFCTYTINPKTGKSNKPKCSTYSAFLYMYLNDDQHVRCGRIDSYDIDEFRLRFGFIAEKFGVEYLSKDQQFNIRVEHYQHVIVSAGYQLVKYTTEETKAAFKAWLTAFVKHVKTCDFKDLVDYPEQPVYDDPDATVKMIVTTYEPKAERIV